MKKKNEPTEQQEIDVVALEDSDGNEIVFEVIATVQYGGEDYIVLLPAEGYGDADEYTILRFSADESGEIEEFYGIDDYNTLMAVYKKFCEENPIEG